MGLLGDLLSEAFLLSQPGIGPFSIWAINIALDCCGLDELPKNQFTDEWNGNLPDDNHAALLNLQDSAT